MDLAWLFMSALDALQLCLSSVSDYVGIIAGLIAAVWVVLLVLGFPPCSYHGWTLCVAASEPTLPLGATFIGVIQTNHHADQHAGIFRRILAV